MSSLFAIEGRAVHVPAGFSKVRGIVEATDLIWEPSTATWVEVRIFRPDYIGLWNNGDGQWQDGHLMAAIIRSNERF